MSFLLLVFLLKLCLIVMYYVSFHFLADKWWLSSREWRLGKNWIWVEKLLGKQSKCVSSETHIPHCLFLMCPFLLHVRPCLLLEILENKELLLFRCPKGHSEIWRYNLLSHVWTCSHMHGVCVNTMTVWVWLYERL